MNHSRHTHANKCHFCIQIIGSLLHFVGLLGSRWRVAHLEKKPHLMKIKLISWQVNSVFDTWSLNTIATWPFGTYPMNLAQKAFHALRQRFWYQIHTLLFIWLHTLYLFFGIYCISTCLHYMKCRAILIILLFLFDCSWNNSYWASHRNANESFVLRWWCRIRLLKFLFTGRTNRINVRKLRWRVLNEWKFNTKSH